MWTVKEELGKQYIYVSKNVTSDVAATNFFGKAAAWVSGAVYAIGDRVTSVSIQYYNKTGVNTTTAPASDTTNWDFDKSNYQTYATTQVYSIGDKTNYSNEHYTCNVSGSTGAFQVGNWTKVTVSNRLYPYRLQNTAINLINADSRFVSYETLDLVNNTATYTINMLLSNGKWNESLTAPTKYIKIKGQSKFKTIYVDLNINISKICFDNLYTIFNNSYVGYDYNYNGSYKLMNCIINYIPFYNRSGAQSVYFFYKNILLYLNESISGATIYHFNSNTIMSLGSFLPIFPNTLLMKNNFFKGNVTFPSMMSVNVGNIDGNYYNGTVTIGGVSQANIAAIRSTAPFQNGSSYMSGITITLNSDYTLPVGCVLLNTGLLGNHIGAEGFGIIKDTTTALSTSNGATYRNGRVISNNIYRDQVAKIAQAGSNNTITLSSDASSTTNEYNGFKIWVYQGAGSGNTKTITSYDGSTKIATVDTNWTGSTPNNTSYYEIMDGEITSSIVDLGLSRVIKKINFSTVNNYDTATSTILTQHVGTDDCRTINSDLNFELKVGLLSDLSDGVWRKFKQDEFLMIDGAGVSCGDSSFNPDTVASTTLTFRYYQIRVKLHK